MNIESKTFNFELKASDDNTGIIEGYLSVFNNVDQGKDMVLPGAFKRTLQNSKKRMSDTGKKFLFPVLWQHDQEQPIGGGSDAKEDSHGLYVVFQLDMDTQKGRETYSAYKKGYMDQLSIGYDVIDKKWNKDIRELIELRLWEGSTVTFAMNEEALASAKARKDFNDHYEDAMASDVLEDLWDCYCALTQAFRDAFSIGDQPIDDMKASLTQFMDAMLAMTQRGIDTNLSQYLSDQAQSSNSYYGMMGVSTMPDFKHYLSLALSSKGGGMSAAKKDAIHAHIDTLHTTADKVQEQSKVMKGHSTALHTAADDLATVLEGSEPAYTSDPGQSEDGKEPKANSRTALGIHGSFESNTHEIELALKRLGALTK